MTRVGIITLLVLAVAGCGDDDKEAGSGQGPADVAEAYLDAVADGDGPAACALLTEAEQQNTVEAVKAAIATFGDSTCEEAIAELGDNLEEGGADKLRAAEVEATKIDGTKATVRFKGGIYDAELEQVDGRWLVSKGAIQKTS